MRRSTRANPLPQKNTPLPMSVMAMEEAEKIARPKIDKKKDAKEARRMEDDGDKDQTVPV